MRKSLALSMALVMALALAAMAGAAPRGPRASKPGAAVPAPATHQTSVTGIIKGTPSGNTFVVARRGGPINVDATGAKVQDAKGHFVKLDNLKGGMMVTAKGSMMGTMLMAKTVTIHPTKGGAAAGKGATKPPKKHK